MARIPITNCDPGADPRTVPLRTYLQGTLMSADTYLRRAHIYNTPVPLRQDQGARQEARLSEGTFMSLLLWGACKREKYYPQRLI